MKKVCFFVLYAAAAAKSLQSCPTLCNPIDGSPPRLPRPWDSPGKNTGVGCHFLLQCRKVKSESEVAQSCPTPSKPMDCSLPGSSIPGTLQARILEWVSISFSNACMHAKSLQLYPTVQPHGQQPTRLLCPQNSLGKSTGVGCHFLLHIYIGKTKL